MGFARWKVNPEHVTKANKKQYDTNPNTNTNQYYYDTNTNQYYYDTNTNTNQYYYYDKQLQLHQIR